ncbi:MAG: PfkB family carbohydrate kinase [Pyrinomonadaceae bacterium]
MADINHIIREVFPTKKIVILGDLVADQFLNGTISRVSREAPVFILRHEMTNTVPGAAANAAINVASLGGKPTLIGITGCDANGKLLTVNLGTAGVDCDGIVSVTEFSTTTKVRVLAGQHYAARQQVIRIDYENSAPIFDGVRERLKHNMATAAVSADALIVSDYNYGAVFPEIYDDARSIAASSGIPLIVDSRYRLADFRDATTATPNREEVEQILGQNFTTDDCSKLRERLGFQSLLITNGNNGMMLFQADRPPLQIDVVGSTEPVDVTGAGDTVIAAYALGLASGLGFADAAAIANHAGGIVVMKKGTASVTPAELLESLIRDGDLIATTNAR